MTLSNALYLSAPEKLPYRINTLPRIVKSEMNKRFETYLKSASAYWLDFPTATPLMIWGQTVDGSQSFTATTDGVTIRTWATLEHPVTLGKTYLLSFTVDSFSGTMVNNNVSFSIVATTGTNFVNVTSTGRYVMVFTASASGTISIRMGIGTSGNGPTNASIKFSNVMIEKHQTRVFPSEYVSAGHSRVFNYDYSVTIVGGKTAVETVGARYSYPKQTSVLVVGDSFTNDAFSIDTARGDFPWQMRVFNSDRFAISSFGVAGETIAQTTTQMNNAMVSVRVDSRAAPFKSCIMQGGVNDVIASRTLLQLQTDRLACITAALGHGMIPVLMTIAPYDPATAPQQVIIDDYNTWLKTLGYRYYDMYSHANDGAGNFKASWGTPEGIHPGGGIYQGSEKIALKMIDLISLIGGESI